MSVKEQAPIILATLIVGICLGIFSQWLVYGTPLTYEDLQNQSPYVQDRGEIFRVLGQHEAEIERWGSLISEVRENQRELLTKINIILEER